MAPTTRVALFVLAIALFAPSQSWQDERDQSKDKIEDIRLLLEVTGSAKLGEEIFQNMLTHVKQLSPDVPKEFWDELQKSDFASEMTDLIIPVYDKHFTHEEIKGLLEFYETPLGERLIEKLPVIMRESMEIGGEWGQQLAERILKKMQEEGY